MAGNTNSTDIELMQRVLQKDSKALETLYNRYSSILYTILKKIVPDDAQAEEVFAEVFVIIWRKADHFDFETGNVYTWLVQLARNKGVDSVKRMRETKMPEYNDEYENAFIIPRLSPVIDPLDIDTSVNLKESIESAFNQLTEAQRYVINLAYYEGYTQQDIADKLNIPLSTVKSKIKLALISFKENLLKGEE